MTGAQIPRYRIEPERVTTDGADAAALMAAYGIPIQVVACGSRRVVLS